MSLAGAAMSSANQEQGCYTRQPAHKREQKTLSNLHWTCPKTFTSALQNAKYPFPCLKHSITLHIDVYKLTGDIRKCLGAMP